MHCVRCPTSFHEYLPTVSPLVYPFVMKPRAKRMLNGIGVQIQT